MEDERLSNFPARQPTSNMSRNSDHDVTGLRDVRSAYSWFYAFSFGQVNWVTYFRLLQPLILSSILGRPTDITQGLFVLIIWVCHDPGTMLSREATWTPWQKPLYSLPTEYLFVLVLADIYQLIIKTYILSIHLSLRPPRIRIICNAQVWNPHYCTSISLNIG